MFTSGSCLQWPPLNTVMFETTFPLVLVNFSPPTYSGTVIILFLLLFLFLSFLLIFLFLLSSFIRARVPHAKTMVKLALGEKSSKKVNTISVSNNTVHYRISQLSDDIKEEVIQEIKRAG